MMEEFGHKMADLPLYCNILPIFLFNLQQVIHMLVVIIVTFIACWTPYLIINVLQSFGVMHMQLHGITKHLKTTFTLTAYLNR